MNNPHIRERLATTALAAVIIGAAIVALPEGRSPGTATVRGGNTTENAEEDVGQERRAAHAGDGRHGASEGARTDPPSPIDREVVEAAADMAREFAVEFSSWRYDESHGEREERLSSYLTERGRTWLGRGSSGLAEVEDQRRRRAIATAELAFIEPIQVTTTTGMFLVGLRVTVADAGGVEVHEETLTVSLQREHGGPWTVDHVGV